MSVAYSDYGTPIGNIWIMQGRWRVLSGRSYFVMAHLLTGESYSIKVKLCYQSAACVSATSMKTWPIVSILHSDKQSVMGGNVT